MSLQLGWLESIIYTMGAGMNDFTNQYLPRGARPSKPARSLLRIGLCTTIVGLALSHHSTGYAIGSYRAFIPTVIDVPDTGCGQCHAGPPPPRNAFGLTVQQNKDGAGNPNWAALCPLDSDNDGFTNGAEFGDPNCGWSPGQPALTAVSSAADPNSTPDGNVQPPPVVGADDLDVDGGCSTQGAQTA
ncbi:MAG: hypothetical protein KTR25_06365, partial [Myxococcales bacterium]|nr:hypothetical protein [Myxococcales bacterium]